MATPSGNNSSVSMAKVSHADKRIAVVGMAVQYAESRNKEEFWETLIGKKCGASNISDKRLGSKYRDEHYCPERSKFADTFCNEKYGCIDESVDNEHDLLLGLAKRALLDAQKRRGDGKPMNGLERCGIVSGCLSFPMDNLQGELLNLYQNHVEKKLGPEFFTDVEEWSEREASLNPKADDKRVFIDPASYVAQELGLGPLHYCVDAACASALYVLRLAQDHLVSGAADIMMCGATCFPEPFFILSGFSTFHAMPLGEGGVSWPLHDSSQGLTPGEGGSIMVLKRLEDAVRDGDHIYGTLLGANISNAGCGLPLSPHQPSEESCMLDTYSRIEKDPKSVQYVEMHATGTPQGDRAEIEAVKKCFEGKIPRFGSTKGNFGHTLVAAGFAGMCKVLLSMEKGVIPPTPGVDETNKMDPLVVTETMPWPDTNGDLKRAGLSAFGFGGTNAHAVFEEYDRSRYQPLVNPGKLLRSMSQKFGSSMKMAIVGMDATFGTLKGLDAFEGAIYNGTDAARDLPEKRWRFFGKDQAFLDTCGVKEIPRGCYIEDVDVDFKRLRTPLTPNDILRPQQLLAVSTIDRAVQDSSLKKGQKVAVLVGLGTDLELYRHRARVALKERLHSSVRKDNKVLDDLMKYVNDCGTSTSYTSYIGNLVATRVSSQWGFTGPSFTITEGNNSVYRCAEVGKYLLETGEVEAVVIAGVDLCASAENLYCKTRRFHVSSQEFPNASFERSADGYFVGEGCGALVMKRAIDCQPEERVYACIDAIVSGTSPMACASAVLNEAKLGEKDKVELLELSADSRRFCKDASVLPDQLTAEAEVAAMSEVFGDQKTPRGVAIGSVKATVGDVGYASGAASLIKTALCLYNRYLPANPNWHGPSKEMEWSDSLFTCEQSRAWVKNPHEKRVAAVSGVSESGSCYGLVLSDSEGQHEQGNRISLNDSETKLLVIRGDSPEEIVSKVEEELDHFKQATGAGLDTNALEAKQKHVFMRLLGETIEAERQQRKKRLVLSLVTTPSKLQRELAIAAKGIPRCVAVKRDWHSPSGSTFAPTPLGSDKVAFMYGEGRSPYHGVGLDLHRIWPALHETVNGKTTNLWTDGDDWLLPRTATIDELKTKKADFDKNQIEMFRTGVYMSMCFTDFTRQVLNIEPKASFGLSLGEVSMLFALSPENCKLSEEMTGRLRSSEVWASALAVEFQALRKLWNVPQDAPVESFWQGYLVHASREEIERAIGADNKYVRLLIVNDTQSALIGGKPEECLKVVKKLNTKLPALAVSQGMIGHCPEVLPYTDSIGYIHEMLSIPKQPGCEMFSSITNTKLVNEDQKSTGTYAPTIREFVAKLYSKIADFPAIVEAVHKASNDVFIEVGPSNTRAMAVKKILGPNVPHVSVAIDSQRESTWNQILKMTSTLVSHAVPGITLENLYHRNVVDAALQALKPQKPNKFLRVIQINGFYNPDLDSVIPDQVRDRLPQPSDQVKSTILGRKMRKPEKQAATAQPSVVAPPLAKPAKPASSKALSKEELKAELLKLGQPLYLSQERGDVVVQHDGFTSGAVAIPPCTISDLGEKSFLETYGVVAPLYTGAMAKGIASADLVIAAGKRKILGSFGAGGLPMHLVRAGVEKIQAALPHGPYAVNLIHSPFDSNLEKGNVDLFLEKGVRVVEASAFMDLTPQVVRYRVAGLSRNSDGSVRIENRIIAKVSRTELAEFFIRPAPEKLLNKLIASGEITKEQAELAKLVPMADDIAVESDSGGHTDNRAIHVILPLIINVRDRLHKELGYPPHLRVRVGAGGGIGCPQAAIAAYNMGASFLVTGTVNQCSSQSGTCDYVRKVLSEASYSDVTMAPAADMFEQGVELQVLKKGTMFASRAKKLYDLFCKYNSLEEIPAKDVARLEKSVFKKTIAEVWEETKDFYINRLHNPEKINRAETSDPKLKMSLVFRWYLGLSSFWANNGIKERSLDYQIWSGPCIGSFNDFVRGSYLDPKVSGHYASVDQINLQILRGAAYLQRLQSLRLRTKVDTQDVAFAYTIDHKL